ncbi:rhomboid family intramembrane serine protease [Flavobacterium crassostreae]|uniref:Rhomboid family intramembrane serine protease n=1 Tax=Flavobacterium crassostreae TaxID=1763534 RepID=A0A1B9E3G6_9FLAO|nr:rhomboid family intramembrane serine protease [Flavobacterium crassostreae]OCB76481.1 rhomboid family intramembrane serine protease [Flavobacterium crassostreae]
MTILDDLKLQYKLGGITHRLIYWNVGCFLISLVFFYQFSAGNFNFPNWIALHTAAPDFLIFPWTFLTYAFFHDGFWHLLFNMVILNFASSLFLTFFTQKQLLGLYVLGAIFAGIIFVGAYFFLNLTASIVGASAAIMAVLVAITSYQPLLGVQLLVFGKVKLWQLTAVVLIIDLMQFRLDNTGGHLSHLAGAFFGWLFIQLLQNGTDLSKIVTAVLAFFANPFQRSSAAPFKKVHKNYTQTVKQKPISRIVTKDKTQQQIDEILDKISQSGYDSLSKEEKEFLFKTGK